METWINCFSRARIRMEKLAYYLLQPLRPENWKTQGATYLVLRKNEGLNAENVTNYQTQFQLKVHKFSLRIFHENC